MKKRSEVGSTNDELEELPFDYGFASGRHSSSTYLKIGATVFCFGHMIHTGLILAQKIVFVTDEDESFRSCVTLTGLTMSCLQPIWAFYQLFFIYKYANLIINCRMLVARFGLMHCIGTSLCFWIYTILQETLQALFEHPETPEYPYPNNTMPHAEDLDPSVPRLFDVGGLTRAEARIALVNSSVTPEWVVKYGCQKDDEVTNLINQVSRMRNLPTPETI